MGLTNQDGDCGCEGAPSIPSRQSQLNVAFRDGLIRLPDYMVERTAAEGGKDSIHPGTALGAMYYAIGVASDEAAHLSLRRTPHAPMAVSGSELGSPVRNIDYSYEFQTGGVKQVKIAHDPTAEGEKEAKDAIYKGEVKTAEEAAELALPCKKTVLIKIVVLTLIKKTEVTNNSRLKYPARPNESDANIKAGVDSLLKSAKARATENEVVRKEREQLEAALHDEFKDRISSGSVDKRQSDVADTKALALLEAIPCPKACKMRKVTELSRSGVLIISDEFSVEPERMQADGSREYRIVHTVEASIEWTYLYLITCGQQEDEG